MKKKPYFKRKSKGAITDMFVYLIVMFVFIVIIVLFTFMVNTTNTKLREKIPMLQESLGTGVNVTQVMDDSITKLNTSMSAFKWISIMIMVGMSLSLILSGFLVKIHPVFFIANILLLIVLLIVAVPLSNTYEKLYNNEKLGATFHGFYGLSWIWLNLPIWVLVTGALSIIVGAISMSRGDSMGGMY